MRGEGGLLWDADGREYLDFLAGISVCSLGHCHPAVVDAVTRAGRAADARLQPLLHRADGAAGASGSSESSLGGRVFFANSGTEANEARDQGRPQARPRARDRGAGDRQLRGRVPRADLRGALAATPGLARNEALGPMPAGFALRAADNDADGAARRGRAERPPRC